MTEDPRPEETAEEPRSPVVHEASGTLSATATITASAEVVTWTAEYPPGDISEWDPEPLWSSWTETTSSAAVVLWRLLPLAPTPLRLDPRTWSAAGPPRSRPSAVRFARSHRSHAPPMARPRAEEVAAGR